MRPKLAPSVLVLALAGGTAMAGSLTPIPVEPVVTAPAPVASVPDWTGGYLGLQGGYGFGPLDSPDRLNLRGWAGGAYAGYNWQAPGNWVLGIEGDIVGGGPRGTGAGTITNARLDWSGALRARAGVAMGNTLIYGAAGVTHAGYNIDGDTGGRTGWTAGLGIEQMLTRDISGRIEYRYNDYGTFAAGGANNSLRTNEIRLGVAFHF